MIAKDLDNLFAKPFIAKSVPFLFFLIGIWYFCIRILGVNFEYIPGDLGDSRYINYLLEHGYQWIAGTTPSFWTAGFMYPFENSLALSDNMLGTLPMYAVWRFFGCSQETSYQLWWVTVCALNYWSAYFVLKKWFNRWELAVIGAWIFAFTVFNLGQLNYMQMIIRFMVPVVIYASIRLVDTGSWKFLALYSLGIVYQFYSVIYTGFFLMYFSLLLIFVYVVLTKKWTFFLPLFHRKQVIYSVTVIIVATTALGWLMLPYYEISKLFGLRYYDEVKWYVPVTLSYLYVHPASHAWHSLSIYCQPNVPSFWIHFAFPGMIPLLAFVAFPFIVLFSKIKRLPTSRLMMATGITALLILLLYTRTYSGYTLYALLFKLPGMNSMRVLSRFMNVELFLFIVLLLLMLKKLNRKWLLILPVLMLLDNSFVPERVIREKKEQIVARRIAVIKEVKAQLDKNYSAFAIVGGHEEIYLMQLDAMLASNHVHLPTVNGYSSNCPPELGEFYLQMNNAGLQKWLELNNIDTSKVLIIERKHQSQNSINTE